MDRLEFLKKGALVAAGTVVGGSVLSGLMGVSGCSTAAAKQKKIGLQLYSLRDAMGQNPAATLKLVADMGYKELETASYNDGKLYGFDPKEFRKMAEDLGMSVSSAHLGQGYDPEKDAEIMEWWKKALDTQVAAGCRYTVQPWMEVPDSLDGLKMYCDYYNKVGELAKSKGIRFGFHNHAGEFKVVEGQVAYDYLIQNTSPDLVFYQMDVYWVNKGGKSPVEYLNKYAGRFPVLHIKDETIIGDSGELDFGSIFDAAYKQGMEDYYVEVERYTLPAENCVEKSYDFLFNADYVK